MERGKIEGREKEINNCREGEQKVERRRLINEEKENRRQREGEKDDRKGGGRIRLVWLNVCE